MINNNIFLIFLCLWLSACASVVRNPVPEADYMNVTVLDRTDLRQWGDRTNLRIMPHMLSAEDLEARFGGIMHREHNYLVVSGGGANGAYGAGVLVAWTKLGTRPEFTLVTGVSTGALTAPFAFLGSEYDAKLQEIYSTLDTQQIIDMRNVFAIASSDSVFDSSPLSRLIEKFIDDEMIQSLAREYHKGRTLMIGTTNLDASRPVVWNITRIAAGGHPLAAKLIHQVLLASASIPGAFPPVYIEVETPDGRKYDEMHVDGGVTSQMFLYPVNMDWGEIIEALDVKGAPTIYVIRNAFAHEDYKVVNPRLIPITDRTISSLIRTQGVGDFYRIWTLADRDGLDLEVTWIPDEAREEIGVKPAEVFDPKYMKALFEYGYQRTIDKGVWQDFSKLVDDARK